MFENCGRKLRIFAYVDFALFVAGGVAAAIGLGSQGDELILVGILVGILVVFIGWVSTVVTLALAEAAENATEAAYFGEEILREISKLKLSNVEVTGSGVEVKSKAKSCFADAEEEKAPSYAAFDTNKVPAWKRVQMEQKAKAKEQQ